MSLKCLPPNPHQTHTPFPRPSNTTPRRGTPGGTDSASSAQLHIILPVTSEMKSDKRVVIPGQEEARGGKLALLEGWSMTLGDGCRFIGVIGRMLGITELFLRRCICILRSMFCPRSLSGS